MKKILIISDGFPEYGGQATTAYNLHFFLESKNFESKLLFLNDGNAPGDVDPRKNEKSQNFKISHGFLTQAQSMLFSIKHKIFKSNSKSLRMSFIGMVLKFIRRKIREQLIALKMKSFIKKNNYHPDLVITNSPLLYSKIHEMFNETLVIIGTSLVQLKQINTEIVLHEIIENTSYKEVKLPKFLIKNLNKSYLIFNSKLTKNIYELAGVKSFNRSIFYFNFAPYNFKNDKEFIKRKYDIAYVAANFEREIKNPELAHKLFEKFPECNKIAIGKESDYFSEITNTVTRGLITQKEIAEILSETKLLIIPSHFDSSPSVMSEAVLNGCNILLSKNVGWNETIDERCVVQNFQNHNEWVSKIEYLIKNKIENKEFLDIINNSKQEIYSLIDSLAT
jgi:glycosyltransferase involved in cell wall biosynthesis